MNRGIRILVVFVGLAIAASVTLANAAPPASGSGVPRVEDDAARPRVEDDAARPRVEDDAARPRVEVAFVLDSTGSMGGLIEGAKQKIWSIANAIVGRRPSPEVLIGLVSYRDRGDEYVTRLTDLTDDIDAVFATLQSFRADGGGDSPESVNAALHDAVTGMSWSTDPGVLRVVFLVGDCPPHMDYRGEPQYPDLCAVAVERGIVINTVQCGDVPETARVWREIAGLAGGSFVALAQDGNMQAIATPYDEEIAEASAALGRTVVPYGRFEVQAEVREKAAKAEAAAPSVAADRAVFNLATGGRAVQGAGDLVADLAAGAVDLAAVDPEDLPPELRGKSLGDQRAYLQARQVERDALNAHIERLARERADWLEAAIRRASGSGDSFDRSVAAMIEAQAARVLR